MSAVPLLALIVALPVLMGLFGLRLFRPPQAMRLAIATAALLLIGTLALCLWYYRHSDGNFFTGSIWFSLIGAPRPLFGVDALSAPLLPFTALITLATVLGMPRADRTPQDLGTLLLSAGLLLALFLCLDLGVIALLWSLSLLIEVRLLLRAVVPLSPLHRALRIVAGLAGLPVLLSVMILAWRHQTATPLYLVGLSTPPETYYEAAVAVLLGLAVFARSLLLPVLAWALSLPSLRHRTVSAPPTAAPQALLPLRVVQPSIYLLARVLLPLSPQVGPTVLSCLLSLGLLTALVAALIGLAQSSLPALLTWVLISHFGLIVSGLCAGNTEGIAGALVQWLAIGTSLGGLFLLTSAALSRHGSDPPPAFAGWARHTPRLSASFLLFAIAALGFPGTVGFVAEDLLLHGLIETHPPVAIGLLLVTVLNGIALLRAFANLFLGPSENPLPALPGISLDLRARERLSVLLLLAPLFWHGLLPNRLVGHVGSYAVKLAHSESATDPAHSLASPFR